MRTKHSFNNILVSIFSQIVIIFLGFISRKVFLDSLGINYLGVNGLLTNINSMMTLVESGIGLSIVYNLYKPLAQDDKEKIIALVQLYKKAYMWLAMIILMICIGIYPFFGYLMKDGGDIPYLSIIYFLFVAKLMVSYLNAHKWSLINADQRGYVLGIINLLFQILTTGAKILFLIITSDYIVYLILDFLIYGLQNYVNGGIVEKRYPYIKTKQVYVIDKSTRENIVSNVKALFLHNIGGFTVFGSSSILISSFVSVAAVGLYSNYTMIVGQLSSLLNPILSGTGASVGNLVATESSDKNYSIFKVIYLCNFWLYSVSVVFLFNLLQPFINWWLGDIYLMSNTTVILILINFYLTGLLTAIGTFKNRAGLFAQDKYVPLFAGFINIASSVVLVKCYDLQGVFIGMAISILTTLFWVQPVIVYKYVFKKSVWTYFMKYGFYAVLTFLTCCITTNICNVILEGSNFVTLVLKGILCLIVPNIIYTFVFYKTEEFQYMLHTIKNILGNFKKTKEQPIPLV